MLSKCANPACGAKFQYFHLGKLFAMEYRRCTQGTASSHLPETVQTSDGLRYFWLCSACSQSMTVQLSGAGGVRLARGASTCKVSSSKQKLNDLMKELEFVERGGYREPLGWRPALIFEDSPICPKPPFAVCPDARCVLLEFVPAGMRNQTVPCQYIPLSEAGETPHTMYRTATIDEIESALRQWLQTTIAKIEKDVGSGPDLTGEDAE